MRIEVFDPGAGNLRSLTRALEVGGARVHVQTRPAALLDGDALVLTGGGAFAVASRGFRSAAQVLNFALRSGFPCLGIGLGMHLLMESSENEQSPGIGVFAGTVRRLPTRRPWHLGWSRVEFASDPLFTDCQELIAYFANRHVCVPADGGEEIAWTIHEHVRFPAAIRRANTWGIQFHPEKSGRSGRRLVGNFLQAIVAPRPVPLPT